MARPEILRSTRGRQRHWMLFFDGRLLALQKVDTNRSHTNTRKSLPPEVFIARMSLKQFLYKANDIPGTHHRNTKKYPGLDEFPLGQELKTQVHKVELFFKMNGTKQNNRVK